MWSLRIVGTVSVLGIPGLGGGQCQGSGVVTVISGEQLVHALAGMQFPARRWQTAAWQTSTAPVPNGVKRSEVHPTRPTSASRKS